MKTTAKTQKSYTVPGDIELDGKRFSYLLTYKPIRHMYLRVKAGGLLSVTLPFGVPVEQAEAFLVRERAAIFRLAEQKETAAPAFEGGRVKFCRFSACRTPSAWRRVAAPAWRCGRGNCC